MLRRRERDNKYSAVDLVWNEACGSCQHQLYRFSCSKTFRSAFSNKTINNCPIWKASCHLQHFPCQFYYLLLMADHLNLPYHLNFKLLYSFQWTSLPFFLLSNDFIMKFTINTTSFLIWEPEFVALRTSGSQPFWLGPYQHLLKAHLLYNMHISAVSNLIQLKLGV